MKHPVWWVIALIFVCLLVWLFFVRIPPPEPGSGRRADASCEELLAKKNHLEALAWVSESKPDDTRTIGEQSPDDSLKIVRRLYADGAKQVWAVDIEKYAEGQSTKILIVALPDERGSRKRLFHLEAKCAASEGFDPVSDDGQHYMFLYKFKLAFHL